MEVQIFNAAQVIDVIMDINELDERNESNELR
jgi:hypothetical protein